MSQNYPKYLVVFDLDHTLIKVNTSFAFGKYLYAKGEMPFFSMLKCMGAYFLHKSFRKPLDWLHKKIFKFLFCSVPKQFFQVRAEEFLDLNLKNLFYTPAYKAFEEAKNANSCIALLSSSPDFIVEPIAKRLGIQYWIGTSYTVDKEGFLCEIASIVDGEFKAMYLKKLIERYQFSQDSITAYTDSMLDLPMMRLAGIRVGVNPEKRLYLHCKAHQWKII